MHKLITLCLALYLALVISIPPSATAHGLEPWMDEILVEASIKYDVWYDKLRDTTHCESMHFNMDVITGRILGRAGEIGAVQLHPRGLLPEFYRSGFSNPRSFTESITFLAQKMSNDNIQYMERNWSCYPRRPK